MPHSSAQVPSLALPPDSGSLSLQTLEGSGSGSGTRVSVNHMGDQDGGDGGRFQSCPSSCNTYIEEQTARTIGLKHKPNIPSAITEVVRTG